MKTISISIEKFHKKFREEYQFLYDNYDRVAGYNEAVAEFDYRMNNDPAFNRMASEFAKYRQDYITSDREAAAYMFAWAEMAEA